MKNKYLLLTILLSLTGCTIIETESCDVSISTSENESSNIENSSSIHDSSTNTSIEKESSSLKDSDKSSESNHHSDSSSQEPSVSVIPSDSSSQEPSVSVTPSDSSSQEPSNSNTPSDSTIPSDSSSQEPSDSSSPSISDGPIIDGELNVTLAGYSFESAYFQWEQYSNATSYNVYCDNKLIDSELIRKYPTYYRADIVGLSSTSHTIDIVPVYNKTEMLNAKESYQVTPLAHVREGFAFVNGTSSGAYNDDGTLKDNAKVIYVDNNNKNTVNVQGVLDAIKKGTQKLPVVFRFIGNITDLDYMQGGDLLIDLNKKTSNGLTFEGIGNDATLNGFGLRIKNSSNVEIRNLGFMNCDSSEGDNISLQQDNHHIWVHNNDLFYGHAGSDADQAKGDGALDTKKSSYITHSYNHFWDSGKCNLQGMKDETTENYITYHHNWYDHSDSRHPRVRTCTVHVYNNYYDGNSKYGVGATMGSSIFVENNYFRNCNRPMSISMQGLDKGTFSSEDGGMIKAYGNKIIGGQTLIKYSSNNTSFDYYDAKSKNEVIPNTVKSLQGGNTYNNFDTASSMYSYNVQSAEDAKENVMAYAGRVQGGDFTFTFTEADDTDDNVNQKLKTALVNYVGYVPNKETNQNPDQNEGNNDSSSGSNNESPLPDDSTNPTLPVSNLSLTFANLTSSSFTSNINVDDVFTLLASSDKKMTIANESVTVDGKTYTKVLKLEGKGNTSYRSIKMELTGAATIKVIAKNNSTSERKLGLLNKDGEAIQSYAAPTGNANVLTFTVSNAGTYYISSLNSGINVYGIIIEYN